MDAPRRAHRDRLPQRRRPRRLWRRRRQHGRRGTDGRYDRLRDRDRPRVGRAASPRAGLGGRGGHGELRLRGWHEPRQLPARPRRQLARGRPRGGRVLPARPQRSDEKGRRSPRPDRYQGVGARGTRREGDLPREPPLAPHGQAVDRRSASRRRLPGLPDPRCEGGADLSLSAKGHRPPTPRRRRRSRPRRSRRHVHRTPPFFATRSPTR